MVTRRTTISRMMRRRGAARGMTLIEVLVAALLLVVGLMGLMGVWAFSFGMTRRNDETAVAYNIARHAVEQMHSMGFIHANPTGLPRFYDVQMQPVARAEDATYELLATLTPGTDQPGGYDYLVLKHLDVSVRRLSDGRELCRTKTYLTLGGV